MSALSEATIRTFDHLSKREATGEGLSFTQLFLSLKLILRQGGLITGTNPAAFTTSDPLRLWIVQVGKQPVPNPHSYPEC